MTAPETKADDQEVIRPHVGGRPPSDVYVQLPPGTFYGQRLR